MEEQNYKTRASMRIERAEKANKRRGLSAAMFFAGTLVGISLGLSIAMLFNEAGSSVLVNVKIETPISTSCVVPAVVAGPAGINGTNGLNGSKGVKGSQGISGSSGSMGVSGTNGTNGTDGNDGTDGTNGTNGTDGTDGKDGTDGSDGSDGSTCPNGADFGSSPTPAFTGYGTVYTAGTKRLTADPTTAEAKEALDIAYAVVASKTPDFVITTGQIGGTTLVPGVYHSGASIGILGDLVLDAENNPDAVFIFQSEFALTTGAGSQIILLNGAKAANVFWQVGSSATLGVGSNFSGHVLAYTSITANAGAIIHGQLLAKNGAVTLDNNIFVNGGGNNSAGIDLSDAGCFAVLAGSGITNTGATDALNW